METSAGNTVRLAGRDWLRFQTRTNYTGVLAIADERRVRQLDPVRISLEVGPMVSLLPLATEVDDNRHRAAEIELAIGPYRKAAQRYFEDNTASSQALSFAVRLINALPPSGNLGKGRLKTIVADARAHLDRTISQPEARAEVERLIDVCDVDFPRRWHMTMRLCIEHQHGKLQVRTNNMFWRSLGGV